MSSVKKLLPCLYELDVLCAFRTSEKQMHMKRCETCTYYKRFVKDMEDEEEEFFEEVDRIREHGWDFGKS